ncbi:MAG: helix-turn-helix domain-containing protein [Candidatus Adiutrix sp.]|nr:helix-turn-helix domain-containing protein [Candidatus Adiutrix sp.]
MAKKASPYKNLTGLAERLENVRSSSGLTKIAAGQRVGVSDSAVSKWEEAKSEPPIAYLAYLAENFACDLNWLILGKENKNASEPEKELLNAYRTINELRKQLAEAKAVPIVSDTAIATSLLVES